MRPPGATPGGTAGAGEQGQRDGRRTRLRRLAWWAVSLAVVVAVAVALRGRWQEAGTAGRLPGVGALVAATAANLAGNALLAHTWREVVALAGARLRFGPAAWVWAASQLTRYTLSGAQVAGRAALGRGAGLSGLTGGATVLVEVAWMTSIEGLLLLATLPWWLPAGSGLTWLAWAGAVPVAVLAAGLVRPRALLTWVARALSLWPLRRLVGERPIRAVERLAPRPRDAARLTGLYSANALLRLVAFLVLLRAAAGAVTGADLLAATGAFAAGQFAGRISVFAPAGIGPREGVTALVLGPAVGGSVALVAVAAVRLVEVAAELAFVAAARMARR